MNPQGSKAFVSHVTVVGVWSMVQYRIDLL